VKLLNLNTSLKIINKEENFKWLLEAFASELFIYIFVWIRLLFLGWDRVETLKLHWNWLDL